MADLTPVAFDIETSGLDDAVITVAGLAHELGEFLILNTVTEMPIRNGSPVRSYHTRTEPIPTYESHTASNSCWKSFLKLLTLGWTMIGTI